MEEIEQKLRDCGDILAEARNMTAVQRHNARGYIAEAEAAGMSQRRIAELLGVDRMTVRKWVGKR